MNAKRICFLQLLHATIILSLVLAVTLTFISESDLPYITLLVFIPVTISYFSSKYISNLFFYLLTAIFTSIIFIVFPWYVFFKISFIIIALYTFFHRFYCKINNKDSWMESPSLYALFIFIGAYIFTIIMKYTILQQYIYLLTFLYLVLSVLYTNWINLQYLLSIYGKKAGFSKKQMKRQNFRVVGILSAIMIISMLAIPALGIDGIISSLLSSSLKPDFSNSTTTQETQETYEDSMMHLEEFNSSNVDMYRKEAPLWLTNILNTIVILIAIMTAIIILIVIIRAIYHFIKKYHSVSKIKEDDYEDEVEFLLPHKKLQRKTSLWKDFSPNGTIRKLYIKRVRRSSNTKIPNYLSPSEIEQFCNMDVNIRQKIHPFYIKARYSKDGCSKKDVQDLKTFLK